MTDQPPLRILIVDDEAPARMRLRDLLGDVGPQQPNELVGMAGNGVEALRLLESIAADVVLADIRMPVMDGVTLARELATRPSPPITIFVTAYDEYAVSAFELEAVDYLLKPVRAERLAEALGRARARLRSAEPVASGAAAQAGNDAAHFNVTERGRILLVPVADVLYLRAEQKYVTAVTAEHEYLLDESLVQIEQAHPDRFIRIHRNCLVARAAIAGVTRVGEGELEGHWAVMVHGVSAPLPISRRQWPVVKHVLVE